VGRSLFAQAEAGKLLHRIIMSDELNEKAVQEIGAELMGLYVFGTEEYQRPVREWLKGKA
jgi:hypothetical protein